MNAPTYLELISPENLAKMDKKSKSDSTTAILNSLLSHIRRIDFREKADLEENAKIPRKLYTVLTVEELIHVAEKNKWGLCTKNGFIYIFNGKFWSPITSEEFKPFLSKVAEKLGVPPFDARHFLFQDELYKQFLASANLPTPEGSEEVLINLKNGTFSIDGSCQELRDFNSADFLKYQLNFEYNPNATAPIFTEYLDRCVPDKECQMVLAESIGYVFIKNLKLEKALILYGSGANGKSVFFEIICALMGQENICSYSLSNLTKYDSYERAELSNKLLNYASEINGKLESSVFKQLVSGEPVQAREIYGKPFIMRDYAKLIFNCNELPKETEQTNAFFRRFLIVPFNVSIPESEQNPELAKIIIETELAGVFNWALAGLKRLLINKRFTPSTLIKEQISEYRKESDSVQSFLDEEGYEPSQVDTLFLKHIYADYKIFSNDNGYRCVSNKTFSGRLKQAGYIIEKTRDGRIVFAKK